MTNSIIRFRDKHDIQPLPPIPKKLNEQMRNLVDTKLNSDLTIFEKLKAVFKFLDEYNAFVATFSVCQKGCSHCCKIDVSVSRLEAEYISQKSGATLNQGNNVTHGHGDPCTFLGKDGACEIYSFRPFNCRTFHTLDDPKYCVDGITSHQVYGVSTMGYGSLILLSLASWLKLFHDENNLAYRDVRDWFPRK